MKEKKKLMDRALRKQTREIQRSIRKLSQDRKKAEKALKSKIKKAGGRENCDKFILNTYAKQVV